MQIRPVRSCALRMAILLISVATLDVAVAFLVSKPLFLCAVIPAAIPILTPVAILDFGQPQG
jgi:hypothetical protein